MHKLLTLKSMKYNNSGKKYLVENCSRVDIKQFLTGYKKKLRALILSSDIELMGCKIGITFTKTGNGGCRYWFVCPLCSSRVGVLFQHPLNQAIGCRKCLNLEYRSRRFKGMIEASLFNKGQL